MSTTFNCGVAALALGLVAGTAPAWADVPPPNTAGCSSKSAGSACKTDGDASGTCATATCTKLDYSAWDKDATSSPPTTSYACLKCDLSATPTPTTAATTSSSGSSCSAGAVGGFAGAAGLIAAAMLVIRRRTAR